MERAFAFLLLLACTAFAANVTVSAPVGSVILYSNGFGYAVRTGTAQSGGGDTTFHIINFTPSAFTSSISARDSAGAISEVYNYRMVWNETTSTPTLLQFGELLNRSLNHDINFTVGTAAKAGRLVWYDGERIGVLANGAFSTYSIASLTQLGSPVSQFSESVESNETKTESGLAVRVANASAGSHALNLGYLVSGADWVPNYKFYITSEAASGSGTLQGWAEVRNGAGEDWNGVDLTLVVGYPRIARYMGYYDSFKQYGGAMAAEGMSAPNAAPGFTYAPFSSYIYYHLSSPAVLADGETRELPLFERPQQAYRREYFWNTANPMPEKVFILNNTSTTPRAAGILSVYLNGEFLGEQAVDYTPRNREMRVTVADIPDINTKKEELNRTTTDSGGMPGPGRTVTDYKYRLTITNAMGEAADLRINDQMGYGDTVRLVSSSLPVVQKPGGVLEWNAHIADGQTFTIDYEYTVSNVRYY